MSDELDRINLGTDSSGRPIIMTRQARLMFDIACEDARVDPTIVQGSFLGADAARASAGTEPRRLHRLPHSGFTDAEGSRLVHGPRSTSTSVGCSPATNHAPGLRRTSR